MGAPVVIAVVALFAIIVIVYFICRSGSDTVPEIVVPKENICQQKPEYPANDYIVSNNLNDLRLNDNFTDIEIISDNVTLRAHKVIVAAHSKYFEGLFLKTQPNQNGITQLDVTIIDPKTLSNLLNFIYSGALPNEIFLNETEYSNLLKAAAKLQMDWLKCEMAKNLQPKITIHNVGLIAVLSEDTDAYYLRVVATNSLLIHFKEVSKTSEWQEIVKKNKSILANAIDFHGKLPPNTECNILCTPSTIASPSVFTRLRHYLITRRFADAEIHVVNGADKKIFLVNRAVLIAQSPVFRKQFAEKKSILVEGTSSGMMEEFLIYMYSGWPTHLKKAAEGLLYLSETYEMKALKKACEDILIDEINIENAARMAEIADKANSERLSKAAVDFILKHQKDVVVTKAWGELNSKNPHILTRIYS